MTSDREYPARPFVGVGGVTIQGDKVLLIRRRLPPLEGRWSIPGGGLELGERIIDGVRRELLEETGIQVRVLDPIEVFERIERDSLDRVRFHYVILDYLCEATGGELASGGDASDAAWVSDSELARYELTETALRVVQKAFSLAAKS